MSRSPPWVPSCSILGAPVNALPRSRATNLLDRKCSLFYIMEICSPPLGLRPGLGQGKISSW